jgi:hypothetical protein
MHLPACFASLILTFAPVFVQQRTWRRAELLLIGAILAPGKRTVTSLLRIAGLGRERRFTNYHRVLNRAAWDARAAARLLLGLLVAAFAPSGPVLLGIDDTIERRRGKRISAKGIDIAMAPDGATVTNLTANENVQVDLPADADVPARRIRAASLLATGSPTGGIQNAAFVGDVDFHESRPANPKTKAPAADRTAKSQRLDVKTKPGFGDLETAEFHNNVHFVDGTQTADAPLAVERETQTFHYYVKFLPSADGSGFAHDPELVRVTHRGHTRQVQQGSGTITFRESQHDPVIDIPILSVGGASYTESETHTRAEVVTTIAGDAFLPFAFAKMDDLTTWLDSATLAGAR